MGSVLICEASLESFSDSIALLNGVFPRDHYATVPTHDTGAV